MFQTINCCMPIKADSIQCTCYLLLHCGCQMSEDGSVGLNAACWSIGRLIREKGGALELAFPGHVFVLLFV